MRKCSIWNNVWEMRGIVESVAFPAFGRPVSVSIVGCSFDSSTILGTDGIGLSLTRTARKNAEEVGIISPSLIGCSLVNMSSIGSSRQPHMSHLNQKMLGCDVSLTSSHLAGSTIRDVNNGGSVLCSNSSFSSFLSSPNTDAPSITYPNRTSTPFFDNGTEYFFNKYSGNHETSAIFSHCHFIGGQYPTNVHLLTFNEYNGAVSILSCRFANHVYESGSRYGSSEYGGAVFIQQKESTDCGPVIVEDSNFTNLTASIQATGTGTSECSTPSSPPHVISLQSPILHSTLVLFECLDDFSILFNETGRKHICRVVLPNLVSPIPAFRNAALVLLSKVCEMANCGMVVDLCRFGVVECVIAGVEASSSLEEYEIGVSILGSILQTLTFSDSIDEMASFDFSALLDQFEGIQ
ncbi:hypothetical protein BLNAU_14787 [Blattamonas nauphoetae]|uniref:Uncharacterized protein n=1 Tax=Blattamonas nauphoetae TaxID=2049346 RepID=A0ABQ9XGE3_9EUKA|nr:hypothetical protein BLNAU_14787 [Blattamonas nauphoetae]